MSPTPVWNVPWLNQNAQRNYPISEEANRYDVTGTFQIPLDLIVDLVWPVQAASSIQANRFFIQNVTLFGDGITITLAYRDSLDVDQSIGSVSISKTTHTRNQSYFISGTGDFFDSVGKITIGDLDNVENLGGSFTFDLDGGRIEPTAIRPNLRGVSSLVLVNGDDRTDPLTGDLEFINGQNTRLSVSISPTTGNPQIRIDAIEGLDLNEDCDCTNTTEEAPCIRTINGIPPDPNTLDFKLVGDNCLKFEAGQNALEVKDECSQSCCGCEELEKILQDLETMNLQINTMSGLYDKMNAQVDAAMINLVASKTGELPCDEG